METTVIPALINGLIQGGTLFLVAVGLNLILGVMGVLNVAHGSFYAIGAFAAASAWGVLSGGQMPAWVTFPALFVIAAAIGATCGPIVERLLIRPTYSVESRTQVESLQLLITYALFLILEDVQKMVWGTQPYYTGQALLLLGRSQIGALAYTNYQLLLIPLAVAVYLALRWYFRYAPSGRFVVAVAEAPDMAAAMGINVGWILGFAFALGTALAALGGALSAPTIGVSIGIGADMAVLSFAVAAVAGLGRIDGAVVAAAIIGVAHAAAVFVLPELSSVAPFAIMLVILLFKPFGLMGTPQRRRI